MSNSSVVGLQEAFSVGDRVRVRPGVMDPDFPGISMEGWAGSVFALSDEGPPIYLVQWDSATLHRADPSCRDRCDLEDMAFDAMWLLEEDLELVDRGDLDHVNTAPPALA